MLLRGPQFPAVPLFTGSAALLIYAAETSEAHFQEVTQFMKEEGQFCFGF